MVLFDSDETSWNIDPGLVEEEMAHAAARGRLPKDLIAVDLYGQCADHDRLRAACGRWRVPIIEDAAEALWAAYRGRAAGTLGALAVLSSVGRKPRLLRFLGAGNPRRRDAADTDDDRDRWRSRTRSARAFFVTFFVGGASTLCMEAILIGESEPTRKLVERARSGDPAAFEDLFRGLLPDIQAYVRSRIRPRYRGRIRAEEVAEDVLARAFESFGSFEGEGGNEESLRRWVFGIARIAVIKATRSLPRTEPLEIVREPEGTGPSPSRVLRREERLARLQAALDSLRDDEREVIRLTRIDGLSMREVAARLSRSEAAVRQIFSRALRKLRDRMPETGSFHLPDRPLDLGEKGAGDARR